MIDNFKDLIKSAEMRIVSSDNPKPYAIVEESTGMVVGKIRWDASLVHLGPSYNYDPGEGHILVELPPDSPVYVGWTYKDGKFHG